MMFFYRYLPHSLLPPGSLLPSSLLSASLRLTAVLFLLAAALHARAGILELENGDRLQGEVLRIEGENLVWQSDSFSELRIKKSQVRQLRSDRTYKIGGNKVACIIDGVRDEFLIYYCGARSKSKRTPLLTLRTLIPYDDFVQGVVRKTGKLNLWGAYADGNEDRSEWNLQGELRLRQDERRHVLTGEYASASWNRENAKRRWHTGYNFDWFFRERWFWYNQLTVGADEKRGLAQQRVLGSGAGYQYWETSKTALSQQLGVAYVHQRYNPPENPEDIQDESAAYGALRAAIEFRYQLALGLTVTHGSEVFQSLQETRDWTLKTSTGLSSMILSQVNSELKLEYWVDNAPLPTKAREDIRLSVGVSYQW